MSTYPPSPAHAAWRCYAMELRCEVLRMLREPSFCIPVLAFPAMFYLLFGVLLNKGNGPQAAQYLLASYGVFGVVGAALFGFGVSTANDRERGLLRLKRALPVPPSALLLARMGMALLFALIISLLLAALAASCAGVRLAASQWVLLWLINLLGILPFAAIGLWVGSLVGGNGAAGILNALYLPMSFLSGLWLPLSMLPAWLSKLALVWPAYHLGQLAFKVLGMDAGQPVWLHLAVLAAFTLLFFALARRRLLAAE